MTQDRALAFLKSGMNVFLTGSAGTGKTYVINKFIQHLRDANLKVAITASTGIAATHIGGTTIHSWSGIGVKQLLTTKDLGNIKKKKHIQKNFKKVKVLIIDEISMLHKEQLNAIHQVLTFCLGDPRPFGGLQVVLCGDFFQLPPIGQYGEKSRDKFAFMADAWQFADFKICYLTEQYRQGSNRLKEILEEIRGKSVSQKSLEYLKMAKTTTFEKDVVPTKLYTHNEDVDFINNTQLAGIAGMAKIFKAKTSGEKSVIEALKKSVLTQPALSLKIGAKVMFVKNNPEKGYINGTLGEVLDYSDSGYPVVKTLEGKRITAHREEWSIEDDQEATIASYKQIPLRLAWAITIHKSQGMTLDAAELDLSRTFEKGQGYVALSRLKTLDKLKLEGFNAVALEVDNLAYKADIRFQELSQQIDDQFPSEELETLSKGFIRNSGGRVLKKL